MRQKNVLSFSPTCRKIRHVLRFVVILRQTNISLKSNNNGGGVCSGGAYIFGTPKLELLWDPFITSNNRATSNKVQRTFLSLQIQMAENGVVGWRSWKWTMQWAHSPNNNDVLVTVVIFFNGIVPWQIPTIYFYLTTSVDTEMCCPKGKCGCQYFILLTLEKKKHSHRSPEFCE